MDRIYHSVNKDKGQKFHIWNEEKRAFILKDIKPFREGFGNVFLVDVNNAIPLQKPVYQESGLWFWKTKTKIPDGYEPLQFVSVSVPSLFLFETLRVKFIDEIMQEPETMWEAIRKMVPYIMIGLVLMMVIYTYGG
jgi:hypothetical protein